MFLAFGLVMEFPILLVGLSRVGIVTSDRLRRGPPLRHPRHRDLLGHRDARWRPREPVRARRHDVPAVRADDPVHQADRPVTEPAEQPVSDGAADQAVVILSGLSGGGKTAAAKLFEDLGYTVVDNLPGELLPELAELVSSDLRAVRPRGDRARRAVRGRDPGARGDARRAGGPRDRAADRVPRGPRRRPHPPVQRDPPPASRSATTAASRARSPRSGGSSTRSVPRPTSSSTRPTCRSASSASGCSPSSRRRRGPTSSPSS